MRHFYFLLVISMIALTSTAQINAYYVLSPMGSFSANASGSISQTVGEMSLVKMFSGGGNILTQGFQQGYLPASVGGVGSLPVKLLDFVGYGEGSINHLKWQTAQEIDNDGFDVQRMNVAGDYESIGIVKGAGNSTVIQEYSLDDTKPLQGENYYRLKQRDIDGKFTYSNIISINTTNDIAMGLSVYPVPATDFLTISINNSVATSATVTLTDIIGTVVYEGPLEIQAGVTKSQLDISNLAAGQYFVRLSSGGVNKAFHIIKQ